MSEPAFLSPLTPGVERSTMDPLRIPTRTTMIGRPHQPRICSRNVRQISNPDITLLASNNRGFPLVHGCGISSPKQVSIDFYNSFLLSPGASHLIDTKPLSNEFAFYIDFLFDGYFGYLDILLSPDQLVQGCTCIYSFIYSVVSTF